MSDLNDAIFPPSCLHILLLTLSRDIRSTQTQDHSPLPCFASDPSQSPDSGLRDLRHPPRSLLAPAHRFLSRLCPWLCPKMQIWGRVKMINSKLIILSAPPPSPGPGQGQMGWGHRLRLSPECWHCLCGRDCAKLEKQEQNKKHQYSDLFGLFVLRMFASSDICLLPVVRQKSPVSSFRHNSAWQFSWHVTPLTLPFYLTPDTLSNLSLATRLLARADLGDLAASARFCREIQIYWGRLFRKWLKISLMAAAVFDQNTF